MGRHEQMSLSCSSLPGWLVNSYSGHVRVACSGASTTGLRRGSVGGRDILTRVVSPVIYGNCPPENFRKFIPIFPEIFISGKFPEILTKNTVQTSQITVYLFTSSLSIGY